MHLTVAPAQAGPSGGSSGERQSNKVVAALGAAFVAAVVTLLIVLAVTLVRGGSVPDALTSPTIWVVEVMSALLAVLVIGAVLAVVLGVSFADLATDLRFVIPATVAIGVAALEAASGKGR